MKEEERAAYESSQHNAARQQAELIAQHLAQGKFERADVEFLLTHVDALRSILAGMARAHKPTLPEHLA